MSEHDHLSLVGVVSATNPTDTAVTWYRKGSDKVVAAASFGERRLRITSLDLSTTTVGTATVYHGPTGVSDDKLIAIGRAVDVERRWSREHGPLGAKGADVFVTGAGVGAMTAIILAELDP